MSPSYLHNFSDFCVAKRLICAKLATLEWNSKFELATLKYPIDSKRKARLNKSVECQCVRVG
ncbi:hypothetical protein GX51_01918 [Blastomyces parvus]|uniref:Uncharacterized protein n=1 Tax=Blastomyces parvus TaxID=2060905 RepID=A0A2B7XEE7_9EURO|nr:hypothetical protein GX51_01918 [Blastomyces parvus]